MSTTITGVGSINSAGIGSGLDVSSIITQLMAVEQRPLTQLQTQASGIKSQVSVYGQLQSYFSALQDKAEALTTASLWTATSASSADASSVSVSAGTGATVGNYAVSVTRLAGMQTVTAAALPLSTSTLNEGSLTIELGTWTGTPTSGFTAKAGSTPVSVTIGAGETSLASIRDKINAAGAGVSASVVNDASGARLSLRSSSTGAENAFRITTTETVDDGVAGTGLSALAYSALGGSSQMSRSETAVDAQATINGIAITSTSNTLTNVIDGLTVTLLKPTTSDVNVSVAADTASIKQKITDFITAFNGAASFLRTQTAYNEGSSVAGALQGDSSAIGLQRALRGVLNQASTASTAFSRLSDIGITMQADGTLAADATKLDAALGNLPELKKLLASQGTDTLSSGFMQRWKALADVALGTGGTFETLTESLNSRLNRNSKDQDRMQLRLNAIESRMRAQYTALDTKMAQLNSLSSYITQQIAQFNNSSDH